MYESTHVDNRNGRAVGVDYTSDVISSPGADGELVTVKADKLVVVSAGAFGSPAILERSGIGATSVLEKHNIRVLVDSPGVGENYQGLFCTPDGPHSRRQKLFYRPFRRLSSVLRIRRD